MFQSPKFHRCGCDNPHIPLPLGGNTGRTPGLSDQTTATRALNLAQAVSALLAQHEADTNDPHNTRGLVKQVRVVDSLPSSASGFNDGDLVLVKSPASSFYVQSGMLVEYTPEKLANALIMATQAGAAAASAQTEAVNARAAAASVANDIALVHVSEARQAEATAAIVAALVALKASRPAFDDTAPLRPPYDSEVAWLESDGAQWLDTGIYLDAATDVVEMSGVVLAATPARIFGARSDSASFNISCGITAAARMIVDFNNGNYDRYRATAAANSIGEFTATAGRDLRSIVIGGATASSSVSNPDAFTTAGTCRVFDVAGDFLTSNRFAGRVTSFKVWRNGVLIMDLQPVRFTNRQDVSEGGAFDRVSGRILGNAGTGAFGLGPDII